MLIRVPELGLMPGEQVWAKRSHMGLWQTGAPNAVQPGWSYLLKSKCSHHSPNNPTLRGISQVQTHVYKTVFVNSNASNSK